MDFIMNENGFQTSVEFGELHISSQDEYGFRPYVLLVSSVVGCSGSILKKILQKMRIPFKDIHVSVDVVRNQKEANRIEEMDIKFIIYGEDISPVKVEKALVLTTKYCSIIQSIKDSIKITERFEIISNQE